MLKTTAFTLLAGFAFATTAGAGTPAPVTPPPSVGLWTWFAGGSVGYLTDLEQPMYSLNLGMEYQRPGASGSHSNYLQVGYAEDDASYGYHPGIAGAKSADASIDMHIIPITLDYKYEGTLSGRLNYYAGLGLGIAVVETSCNWSWSQALPPPYGVGSDSSDRMAAQLFFCKSFQGGFGGGFQAVVFC